MRIKETTIYTFNELSDDAKETARNEYRKHAFDYEWSEWVISDAKQILAIFGVTDANVYFSGFSSQGDGACFDGYYSYPKGYVDKLEAEYPREYWEQFHKLAARLQTLQRKYFYGAYASISLSGRYSHSGTMHFSIGRDGMYASLSTDDEDKLAQILRELADEIYLMIEREYNYLNSDEQIKEALISNEYEFDVSGHMA